MSESTIRVLVVDDTAIYRKIVSNVLADAPGIEVVGTAPNGKIALQKIEQLKPDVLTLDLEMPEMDGLEVLRQLKAQDSPVGAIMLSAFTADGADTTVKALELGAFDFVLKPTSGSIEESNAILKRELCPKINAFAGARCIRGILSGKPSSTAPTQATVASDIKSPDVVQRMTGIAAGAAGKPKVVVLGISTGGPQSLAQMLPKLPADLSVPILIVQHMPPMFTKSLADDLDKKCALSVSEAHNGQLVQPGHIIIAPGGKQMKVRKSQDNIIIAITDDPPENSCKPAVDYLFRSVAHTFGGRALGVIMTGMGNDGSLGCRLLKRNGASILTQDEATCVVYGMPKQPADEGLADVIAPLDSIADEITRLVGGGVLV
ncbi:MAG: chemotaxis response regulator protein-glutamate methylesterase [Sedimentisphaerales bacterium]|nr:chemotaxis response regulator protein-glutamate methylesterase [Sedimentisphaerales bacterium]